MGALLAVSAGLLLFYNQDAHTARIDSLERASGDASPERRPRAEAV